MRGRGTAPASPRRPRTRDRAGVGSAVVGATPRTSAAGTRAAFAITSPLAAAISSARAMTVASSSRPVWSVEPRRSTSAGSPAHPIATFTTPSRHARPNVSVTRTGRSRPVAARSPARIASALASGSSGSNVRNPGATFEASTPAFAQTSPWRVSAMTRSSRRATTRTVSSATHPSRPRSAAATTRPSAFETIFCVTTTTSPARASPRWGARSAARSSPSRTSGSPGSGRISSVTAGARGRRVRPPRPRRRRP